MKNKMVIYILLTIIGVTLILTAALFFTGVENKHFSGLCLGIGAGLLGMSVAKITTIICVNKSPEFKRVVETEEKDERNVIIREKAEAKTYRVMLYVLCVVTIASSIIGTNLYVVLLMCGALWLQFALKFIFTFMYNKKM